MRDLLLVKLPRVPNFENYFFGVGYYSDSGFIFTLLTPDIINKIPSRMFPFPKDTGYLSENQIEIVGKITFLPGVK